MQAIYGIIGYPLGHSRSPRHFNEKFQKEGIDAQYLPFELKDMEGLPALLMEHPGLIGFNVTIPHKQNILPFLQELSDEAREIGAVNCVRVFYHDSHPYLIGYNTDMYGFRHSLLGFIPDGIKKALILGNGGAAKAVRYALHSLGMDTLTVSRCPGAEKEVSYSEVAGLIADFHLIVNTTPLGTWPKTDECPDIPYHLLTDDHYLFDLIYNPATTAFMKRGEARGAHTHNGFEMWQGQADKSWDIWTSVIPERRDEKK